MSSPVGQSSPVTKATRPGGGRIDPVSVVIIAVGLLCFVILFFGWNGLCLPVGPAGAAGGRSVCGTAIGVVSGWAGFGVVAGLAVVCLILWEVLSLAGGLAIGSQAVERQVAAGLSAALAAFTLLRVLTHLTGLTAYAWIGLALAVATCAVAVARWLRYRRAACRPSRAIRGRRGSRLPGRRRSRRSEACRRRRRLRTAARCRPGLGRWGPATVRSRIGARPVCRRLTPGRMLTLETTLVRRSKAYESDPPAFRVISVRPAVAALALTGGRLPEHLRLPV